MMMDDEVQEVLLTHKQYDVDNLPLLVRALHATILGRDFDNDVASGILRLYRFHPSEFDGDTTASILMGALMQLPENDFTLCLSLLHPSSLTHPRVQQVIQLHQLLETCQFAQFWAFLDKHKDLLDLQLKSPVEYDEWTDEELQLLEEGQDVEPRVLNDEQILTCHLEDFKPSILEYVAHIVSATYQTIPKETVAKMTGNLDSERLDVFIDKQQWTVGDDGIVSVRNQEDNIKSQDIVEKVQFNSLVDLLAACMK